MKRILITGIEGFVGRHLTSHLIEKFKDIKITGTYLLDPLWDIPQEVELCKMDITNISDVQKVFESKEFDMIFHLAGISSVGSSWTNPQETLNINTLGTINVLEILRKKEKKAKFLYISSSEVYGANEKKLVYEDSPVNPESPYAISKLAAEQCVLTYGKAYDMPVFVVRPVPHIGPGQNKNFVVINFCFQGFRLKKEKTSDPFISVGNMAITKDFLDVRDVVQAYRIIMEKGNPGEIYNISSGNKMSLKEIVQIIKKELSFEFACRQDKSRIRPHDPEGVILDSTKIKSMGWSPIYTLEESIANIIKSFEEEKICS